MVRIDLDGGVVTQRRLRRNGASDVPASIFGRTGGAVVVSQDQAISVADGPDGVLVPRVVGPLQLEWLEHEARHGRAARRAVLGPTRCRLLARRARRLPTHGGGR